MNALNNALTVASNTTYTENGALSNASTLDAVLDLFAIGASSRSMPTQKRINLILAAFAQNQDLALRTIFWIGDIRGGAGERDMFKIAIKTLASTNPEVIAKIINLIPEYSRWDYIYELVGTELEPKVVSLIRAEHNAVQSGLKESSLMYKWLKSTNTSSKTSCRLGRWTANALRFPASYEGIHAYQRMLSKERAKLKEAVVEKPMSAQKWDAIDYTKVPSKATLKYKKAFLKHNPVVFKSFVSKVLSGEAKMNMAVAFPHDIVYSYVGEMHNAYYNKKKDLTIDEALEAAWISLPNYIKNDARAMTVLDTSGSMYQPINGRTGVSSIDVGTALGIYTAERIGGPFKNKVISFSSRAQYFDIAKYGNALWQKIRSVRENEIVENTNLQSVFSLILDTAVAHKVPQDEMPTSLIIVSDMQFDQGTQGKTNLDSIKAKYQASGYEMPQIIYWNICARKVEFPALGKDRGIALISGYSPSILTEILSGSFNSPLDNMMKVIGSERYDLVSQALKA